MNRIALVLIFFSAAIATTGCALQVDPFSRSVIGITAKTKGATDKCANMPKEMREKLELYDDEENQEEYAYVHDALALADAGDLTGALAVFDKAADAAPSNERIPYLKGAFLLANGMNDEALAPLDKAIAIKPDDLDINSVKSKTLICLSRPDDAIKQMNQFVDALLTPDASDYVVKGYWLALLGRHDEAGVAFRKAAEMDSKDYTALLNIGVISYYTGRYKDASSQFGAAIKTNPEKQDGYLGKGYTLVKLGNGQEALAEFDKAVAFGCESASGYLGKGYAYTLMGNHDAALKELDTALSLSESNRDALLCKAYALIGRNADGDRQAATGILQALIAEEPRDIVAVYAYSLLGDKESMSALMAEIIKAEPTMEQEFRTSPLLSK
ncbi:MAG: tetratricopeptide repeat protein [Nitrospirae bacterium]|nr:tetratricopeptide repeat protein [Nitrospirota bacterium]